MSAVIGYSSTVWIKGWQNGLIATNIFILGTSSSCLVDFVYLAISAFIAES